MALLQLELEKHLAKNVIMLLSIRSENQGHNPITPLTLKLQELTVVCSSWDPFTGRKLPHGVLMEGSSWMRHEAQKLVITNLWHSN